MDENQETEVKTEEEKPKLTEKESLIKEKIELAKKIGIWETFNPVDEFETSPEYQRIIEIDKRLADIG